MMSTSEPLRVLHIAPNFGVGGAEQMACHLMVGLSESHNVSGTGLYPATGSAIEHRLKEAGIPMWHLGKRPGFDPKLFALLDRVLREIRPHVVHTHLSVLRYALPALLRRRVPVVVHTLHNLAKHETDALGRLIQWFAFRKLVLPVAISREVAASVRPVYGLECEAMVPNGIPIEKYQGTVADRVRWREKERFGSGSFLFVCVSRLEPQKNPMMLVQAFEALNDARAHLAIVGEGSLREQLAAYVREQRLEGRVHLLGLRNDIPDCLAASDVFVLSSDWEGNPLAVMEAMAAGLPTVGTAVGGVPELVESGQQGLLVRPGDRAGFTSALRILLNNPEKRAAMANAARARAIAKFSVDGMIQGYANLYRQAVAGSSGLFAAKAAA